MLTRVATSALPRSSIKKMRRNAFCKARTPSLQIPKRVAHRPSPETFRPIMEIGMRRFGLPLLDDYLRRGLLLADLGMVEPAALQAATRAAQAGTAVDSRLADVLRLEHGLRLVWGEL